MKKKTANTTAKTIVKKRGPRHQFKTTYRIRAVHSFIESVEKLFAAHQAKRSKKAKELAGLNLVASYRGIGHAIEMLSKEVLERLSKYLTLESLASFDKVQFSPSKEEEKTCGGKVALGRAAKFFKADLSNGELGMLLNAINNRNTAEHGHMKIKSISQAIKEVVPVLQLFEKVYDREFRDTSLVEECRDLDHNLPSHFKKLTDENSEEFQKVLKKVERFRNQNREIDRCANCMYETALVSADGTQYRCLWCDDERVKMKCSFVNCLDSRWRPSSSGAYTCPTHTAVFLTASGNSELGVSLENLLIHASGSASVESPLDGVMAKWTSLGLEPIATDRITKKSE